MKGHRLKPKDAVGPYQILYDVGTDPTRAVYLAERDDSAELYWLIQSDQVGGAGGANFTGYTPFQAGGVNYLSFPAEGTSLAAAAQFAGPLDWKFVVPRWAALAEEIGLQHARGQLFQHGKPLDLASVLLGHDGRLLAMSFQESRSASVFAAPELTTRPPSAASDVYALGAALLSVLGEGTPDVTFMSGHPLTGQLASNHKLARIIQKATAPDPANRYPDATAFARALAAISPAVPIVREKKELKAPRITASAVILLVLLIAVVTTGALYFLGYISFDLASFSARPAVARPADPTGDFSFQLSNFTLGPDRAVHMDAVLTRGGKALTTSTPLQWDIAFNGQKIDPATIERVEPAASGQAVPGLYRISFSVASFKDGTGSYRVTARLIGTTLTRTIYFEESSDAAPAAGATPSASGAGSLDGVSLGGIQINTDKYPELRIYFTPSRAQGSAVRLQGPLFVEVDQDGQQVGDFFLIPNDPAADPMTAALAIDVSGSMQGTPLQHAEEAAADFVNAMNAADSACIYSFSTTLSRVQSCSTNRTETLNAIKSLQAGGDTALFDVLLSVSDDLSKVSGRKAIVLMTDGSDTVSQGNKDNALARLKETNIPVFGIGLRSADFKPDVLKEFATATGGYYLEAPTAADLRGLYGEVNAQLQNQYRLDLTSLSPDKTSGVLTVRLLQGNSRIEASKYFSAGK